MQELQKLWKTLWDQYVAHPDNNAVVGHILDVNRSHKLYACLSTLEQLQAVTNRLRIANKKAPKMYNRFKAYWRRQCQINLRRMPRVRPMYLHVYGLAQAFGIVLLLGATQPSNPNIGTRDYDVKLAMSYAPPSATDSNIVRCIGDGWTKMSK